MATRYDSSYPENGFVKRGPEANYQSAENGLPDENIVACQACHGPEAQGVREIPRLGGLSYSYLKHRLETWSQGYDASATPMPKVARSLSPNQVAALASYLSFTGGESSEK